MSFSTRYLYLLACLSLVAGVHAQQRAVLINSGAILEQGQKLHDNGQFKEALALYSQVSPSDTNYSLILHEKSLSAYQDSDFTASIRYADSGLLRFPDDAPRWHALRADALDELGMKDSAIAEYNTVLQFAPKNYAVWFSRGVTLFNLKRYPEALTSFEQCVLIYPYHTSAHYFLGLTSIQLGNPVQSMLSFMTSLVINPEGRHAKTIVQLMTAIANVDDEVTKLVSAQQPGDEDQFGAEQEILLSKAALDKQYHLQTDVEDGIVRQMQAILEKIAYRPEDKGFWMQYYVPYLKDEFNNGHFNVLVHEMFSGLSIKAVDEWNKHHAGEIKTFTTAAAGYFDQIEESELLNPAARDTVTVKYLMADGNLEGKGNWVYKGKDKLLTGPWTFYYNTGALKSQGLLDAKMNKQGTWTFFYANGLPKETSEFKDGDIDGHTQSWFDNGVTSEDAHAVKGRIEGVLRTYYYNGLPNYVSEYVGGERSGLVREYTSDGFLLSEAHYVKGNVEGRYTTYFSNGQPSLTEDFVGDKAEGARRKYNRDGVLVEEAFFKGGKETGNWKTYYAGGQLHEEYTFVDANIDGLYREYYQGGQVKQTQVYVKGKPEGKESDYTEGGRLYEEDTYEKGKIREVQCYGSGGKVLSATSIRSSGGLLSYYDSLGNKMSDGNYSFKGDKEGVITYYNQDGGISGRASFKGGERNGPRVNYFRNGHLSDSTEYKDGDEDGYYAYYYNNGRLRQEGWYSGGSRTGPYREYNAFGQLIYSAYYRDGERDGYITWYNPDGRKTSEYLYATGWPIHFTDFDSTGKILDDVDIPPGDTAFLAHYTNGQVSNKGRYRHYHLDGPYALYYFDHSTSVQEFYRQDLKDSAFRQYFYGGHRLAVEGNYRLDNKTGRWTYYYENGVRKEVEPYKEDNLDGTDSIFNGDGTLMKTLQYVNDVLEGAITNYGEDNKISYILYFHDGGLTGYGYLGKDGKPVTPIPLPGGTGAVTAYYPNGQKSVELHEVEGSVDGQRTTWFSNGVIDITGVKDMGKDQGVQKQYYPNGHPKAEENDYYDNLHGLCKYYYPSGVLKTEEYYYNGEPEGPAKSYDESGHLKQTSVYYYGVLQQVY